MAAESGIWYTPATAIIHRVGSFFGPESVQRLRIYYISLCHNPENLARFQAIRDSMPQNRLK